VSKRGFIQREIRVALDISLEMLESDIYLLPVRLDDCRVMENLNAHQWVDLFEEDGWVRLVEAIQVGMQRRGESTEQGQSRNDTSQPLIEFSQETTANHGVVKFYKGAGIGTY
jgi:hypothetical protein